MSGANSKPAATAELTAMLLQVVDNEEEVVNNFWQHLRKQTLSRYSPPPMKKPRVTGKATRGTAR